jgi:hypothetical protein
MLNVPLTRDHLSAIAGLTLDGRLVMHIQSPSFEGRMWGASGPGFCARSQALGW